jgi:hypothetical protein
LKYLFECPTPTVRVADLRIIDEKRVGGNILFRPDFSSKWMAGLLDVDRQDSSPVGLNCDGDGKLSVLDLFIE